jgi:membrane-associated protein
VELDAIFEVIEQYGYIGLFFWLWIGVIGIPIPNEVIVTSVGYAGSIGLLHSFYLFVITYLGLTAAVTTCFVVGKFAGRLILERIKKRRKATNYVNQSVTLINKYHVFSLCISYFIPGLRTMVPFLFGMSGLPYFKFALISYPTVLIWLTLFFTLGNQLGEQLDEGFQPQIMGITAIILICLVSVISIVKWRLRVKKALHSRQ